MNSKVDPDFGCMYVWQVGIMGGGKYDFDLCDFSFLFGELVCALVLLCSCARRKDTQGCRYPGLRVTGLAWVHP